MAFQAKCLAVFYHKSLIGILGKLVDVVGFKTAARNSAFLASVIVAFKDGSTPCYVLGAVTDTIILRRDAPFPVRIRFATIRFEKSQECRS